VYLRVCVCVYTSVTVHRGVMFARLKHIVLKEKKPPEMPGGDMGQPLDKHTLRNIHTHIHTHTSINSSYLLLLLLLHLSQLCPRCLQLSVCSIQILFQLGLVRALDYSTHRSGITKNWSSALFEELKGHDIVGLARAENTYVVCTVFLRQGLYQ